MSLEANFKKSIPTTEGKIMLDVQFQLEKGQTLALTGASGSGKTTLLRILAGLGQAEQGSIQFGGQAWLDTHKRIAIPPAQRSIGMVFQDYALFPNMSVAENLRFAKDDIAWMQSLLAKLGLTSLENRKPSQLSGGQQQRVALARALMRKPDLLLLDEPLSALGQAERNDLQQFLLDLQAELGFAAILVSHDMAEIHRLAHKIAVLGPDGFKMTKLAKEDEALPAIPTLVMKLIRRDSGFVVLEWQGKLHRMQENGRFPAEILAGDWLELPWEGAARKIAPPY